MDEVLLRFSKSSDEGIFDFEKCSKQLWDNFKSSCGTSGIPYRVSAKTLTLNLTDAFALIVKTSSKRPSTAWDFHFIFHDAQSRQVFEEFATSYQRAVKGNYALKDISEEEVSRLLKQGRFTKRILTVEQMRDVRILYSLPHGANFSVPGAGKTTVTLALNTLLSGSFDKMLIICPKSAFQAWDDVVDECIENPSRSEKFQRLMGDASTLRMLFDNQNISRFYINYELATVNFAEIRRFLDINLGRVHLVIDESHRIKAGIGSLRGQLALGLSNLAGRRDILSGTPMPQGASDIASQADFLYPAHGLGGRIRNGESPGQVMRNLFVRTRKTELGLPPYQIVPFRVDMAPTQAAIYSILCNDVIAQFNFLGRQNRINELAKGRVIRLLQASAYPKTLTPVRHLFPELFDAALEDGPSPKMRKAVEIAIDNALRGRKTVIWTIFTETLLELQRMCSDLGAEVLFGGNPKASTSELSSRDAALKRFTKDSECKVLIANPAAASEGFSLHRVCHEAIYIDRTYNAAQYLQSIDRIHRLGLSQETETRVTILKSNIPQGVNQTNAGSVDDSVWRRLQLKVDNLSRLLDDQDLREIAYSEDDALPSDYSDMDEDDVVDLILELTGKAKRI